MEAKQIFAEFVRRNFDDDAIPEKFNALTSLYFEVNSVINISAIRTENEVYIKHYLDSIYPYKYFSGRCCDVGCGGGFPCIPLSIVTGLDFVGLDSVGKKLTLINRFAQNLKADNITSMHARSEDVAKKGILFDTVCARAVSDTDRSLGYCAPLTKKGGRIVLYKTQNDFPAQKTTEKICGVSLITTEDYTLTNTDIKRRLFVYERL